MRNSGSSWCSPSWMISSSSNPDRFDYRGRMIATIAPLRVLFIEDEGALQQSYRRFFGRRYEVASAGSGADAMRQISAYRPEVAVLDMRLPDTDGIDLLRRLRAE